MAAARRPICAVQVVLSALSSSATLHMCMRAIYSLVALTLCAFCRPFKVVPGKDNKPMIEGVPLPPSQS